MFLMMEAVINSETSVYFNEATRYISQRNISFILAAVRS
jgi:hypothetical protein